MPRLTRVALGKNEDGRLEVVATSRDDGSSDTVWHAWQKPTPGSEWTGWHQFGKPGFGKPGRGDLLNRPTTIQHARDGRLEVFVTGGDDAVWRRWQVAKNDGWSEWSSLGKPDGLAATTDPAVTLLPDSRLAAFVTAGGAVWQTSQQKPLITPPGRHGSPSASPVVGRPATSPSPSAPTACLASLSLVMAPRTRDRGLVVCQRAGLSQRGHEQAAAPPCAPPAPPPAAGSARCGHAGSRP